MTEVYCVVNWPYHEHREMPKRAKWIKAKVDFEGDDWVLLTAHEHCVEALAVWEIVRGLAVQSPYRGLLLRDGHRTAPHTIDTIAAKSRLQKDVIARGLAVLVDVLGWVQIHDGDDYEDISKSLWGKVFGATKTTRKKRGNRAVKSREPRGNSAPTLHKITSPNPTSPDKREEDTTSPARADEAEPVPPSPASPEPSPGEVSLEPFSGEVGGEGEGDGAWERGELEHVFELIDAEPRADVVRVLNRANPVLVVGHALDIKHGRPEDRPKKAALALKWRVENKEPSPRHYPDAAKLHRRCWYDQTARVRCS